MSIAYPRTLLRRDRFLPGSFDLGRRVASNTLYAGAVQSIELADPLWVGSYNVMPRNYAERDAWRAWLDSLRGGAKFFWGYHPLRQNPIAYGAGVLALLRHAGGAFDGTATLDSASGFAVAISDLPSNYRATVGDMVSIPTIGSRSLHRVTEDATAVDGVVALAVEPHVVGAPILGSPAVQLVRATALMAVRQDSISAPDSATAPVSFTAVQTVQQ